MYQPIKRKRSRWAYSFRQFFKQQKSGSIVLGISVIVALIFANSPLSSSYFHFWEQTLGLSFNGETLLNLQLEKWVNDGLMAIFFFVVGLELKREFVAGELANPRRALLPIFAAIGGLIVPALFYGIFNFGTDSQHGWGIPMATDIAFALGVLYLLGDKVPSSLKVFLAALAIVDDLGAVLVIAFFYTSEISLYNLLIGLGFVVIMFIGNRLNVKNIWFYIILGFGGVWLAFLLSGVHATIAAVLAAFMVPINATINQHNYVLRIKKHLAHFGFGENTQKHKMLDHKKIVSLMKVKIDTNAALSPLQRLEYNLHPFVSFLIMPIFALANAGVSFEDIDFFTLFSSNIAWGVFAGLFLGKPIGIVGASLIVIYTKLGQLPKGTSIKQLIAVGFIASIGFTMSMFVTMLAFSDPIFVIEAKASIFIASILGGFTGYVLMKKVSKRSL